MSKVLVLGATGATGKALIKELRKTKLDVYALARKPKPADFTGKWIEQQEMLPVPDIKPDHIMCCLGITRQLAGSAENFRKIDHELVVNIAKELYKQNPNATFSYVSSVGANANSWFLYPNSKGLTENDLISIGFKRCWILRPGYLVYDEKRERGEQFLEAILSFLVRFIPFKDTVSIPVTKVAQALIKLSISLPEKVIYEHSEIHKLVK